MADRTDDLREALCFALSSDYEIESADYRRAAGLLVHLGWVPLADVLDALRDDAAFLRWAAPKDRPFRSHPSAVTGEGDVFADYLAERFATPTAPQGADERNGHG